jgi:hypothetical protein
MPPSLIRQINALPNSTPHAIESNRDRSQCLIKIKEIKRASTASIPSQLFKPDLILNQDGDRNRHGALDRLLPRSSLLLLCLP